MSFIDLSHNSILGNELKSLIRLKFVLTSKDEGMNLNIEFCIFDGKMGISIVIKKPKEANNDTNKNLNFLIGISKINVIKTVNKAFLEVVRIIIYIKDKIKINVIDFRVLLFDLLKNKPMINAKTILNQAP